MFRTSALISAALTALLVFAVWWQASHVDTGAPDIPPAAGGAPPVNGVSFSPYQRHQNPQEGPHPSANDIERDLIALAGLTNTVRTYTTLDGLDQIPALAAKYDMRVVLGAWVDKRAERSEREIANAIRLAYRHDNIDRILVGNEAILRADLTVAKLVRYIRDVKKSVKVPVSTAEPWHVWLDPDNRELVNAVDFIAIHVLPYWEGIPVGEALAHLQAQYAKLRRDIPNKRIVFTEVGWPSDGRMRERAAASIANQAAFVRGFIKWARAEGVEYYIMEAFDQPWKFSIEGKAGGYWGMLDAERRQKWPLEGPVTTLAEWPYLAAATLLLALPPLLFFFRRFDKLKPAGEIFFAACAALCAGIAVWSLWTGINSYQTPGMWSAWIVLFLCLLATTLLVLSQALELTEILWLRNWRRVFLPAPPQPAGRAWPKVSLHLPICNEPPHMVRQSLDALAALDYPNFEVLVIDNNTKEEATWRPVEAYCRMLGPRFRFFHLDHVEGFKAGALNFALRQTAPDADYIGVCDSDYMVEPGWLAGVVPYLDDPKVGFVQCPQDHRDWPGEPFKEMLNWEYAGFFHAGMCHRNEYDAIIQHGTMTVIRKAAIEAVGDWAQWCICEDSEMGLRLMEGGYRSVYINHAFGKGLTPDSFSGYKKQRFRWAYGAMQIIKGHWRAMLPWVESGLSFRQKYHFIAGWVPWIADAVNLLFTFASLLWAAGVLAAPQYFDLPLTLFLVPTLGLFVFKAAYSVLLYRARVPCSWSQTVGASIAGLALIFTVGRATLHGILTRRLPFMRTPKMEDKPALLAGLTMAWEETALALALWAAAIAVWMTQGQIYPEARIWAVLMVVQSLPYLAALFISMVNALSTLQFGRTSVIASAPHGAA